MKRKFLFISCEEAQEICDKSQYGEATAWEKLKLNLRYLYCSITRKYVKRNKKLSDSINQAPLDCLQKEELNALQKEFNLKLEQQKQG
ncbi:MAG: hypothetical protein BM564_10165 [Bacteroidetes bacterium MedPE-SWsnd-G2]|nr:MAG: hypothetical protein BM564_10165 [Bacteroidetes bacterium MedPE-SWsnd-G2]